MTLPITAGLASAPPGRRRGRGRPRRPPAPASPRRRLRLTCRSWRSTHPRPRLGTSRAPVLRRPRRTGTSPPARVGIAPESAVERHWILMSHRPGHSDPPVALGESRRRRREQAHSACSPGPGSSTATARWDAGTSRDTCPPAPPHRRRDPPVRTPLRTDGLRGGLPGWDGQLGTTPASSPPSPARPRRARRRPHARLSSPPLAPGSSCATSSPEPASPSPAADRRQRRRRFGAGDLVEDARLRPPAAPTWCCGRALPALTAVGLRLISWRD